MAINEMVNSIILDHGVKKKWVVEQMNKDNPALAMNRNKMSAIIGGNRKMSGEEFISFCRVMRVSPDVFMEEA